MFEIETYLDVAIFIAIMLILIAVSLSIISGRLLG